MAPTNFTSTQPMHIPKPNTPTMPSTPSLRLQFCLYAAVLKSEASFAALAFKMNRQEQKLVVKDT